MNSCPTTDLFPNILSNIFGEQIEDYVQNCVIRLENNIFTPDGVGIIGKLLVCPKCGNLAVVK